MPRSATARVLQTIGRKSGPVASAAPKPRLWNARRRIETRGVRFDLRRAAEELSAWEKNREAEKTLEEGNTLEGDLTAEKDTIPEGAEGQDRQNIQDNGISPLEKWQTLASEDVREFIEKCPDMDNRTKIELLKSPIRYFSRPSNVPEELRKQILFPNFSINIIRTPHLPPRYASFDVPLWFNKLDIKSYLSNVYKVEILHVRSYVIQSKVARQPSTSKHGQGRLYRPKAKKRMTVELVEPFIWPEETEDLRPWEHESYWKSRIGQINQQRQDAEQDFPREPDLKHQKSIAQQAKELLAGKSKPWKPTWMYMPNDRRAMGFDSTQTRKAEKNSIDGRQTLITPSESRNGLRDLQR